jgi:type I restriction enzyme S subunit
LDYQTAKIDRLIEKQQRLIELLEEKRQAVISRAVIKGLNSDIHFKDSRVSWLGDIPAHWSVSKLKHYVRVIGGGTPDKNREDYWEGSFPWVSPKDMKSDLINDSIDHISLTAIREHGLQVVLRNAVLIVVRGMILSHSVPIALTGCEVTINQDMKALLPRCGLNSSYLQFAIKGLRPAVFDCISSSAHGTRRLEWGYFGDLELPCPPVEEQKRIVDFIYEKLDKIEVLRSRSQRMISLLQEHKESLVSSAVTGKIDVREWQPPEKEPEKFNPAEALNG